MSYSCLEELQVDLDLHTLDKKSVLSKAGCKYKNGRLVVTDDGICHLFDKDGKLDDIRKIKQLEETHIKKDITKIVIPNSVTSIGPFTFYNCHSLTSITIPDGVTIIESFVFENCTNLTNVTIGNSVTSIGDWVFDSCDRLTNLTFKGKTFEQVKKMKSYPWGIKNESIMNVE